MAFVIVSTGALAGSTLHTVRSATLLIAAGLCVLAVLAGGLALGFRLGHSAGQSQAAQSPGAANAADRVLTLDPNRPDSRALIDRVGALSGRLIRLESEAMRLARRVGLSDEATETTSDEDQDPAVLQPIGGPLHEPAAAPAGDHVTISLHLLDTDLERIESRLMAVAATTSVQDLHSMAVPSRRPIAGGRISSGFGNRWDPFTRRRARHTGVDIPAPHGAPILASAGGRVRLSGWHGAYGKTVEIDHGNGLVTRYGHASQVHVRRGDVVLPGQKIAAVGSTGRSTGPHLHFEVLRRGTQVEPRLYLAKERS